MTHEKNRDFSFELKKIFFVFFDCGSWVRSDTKGTLCVRLDKGVSRRYLTDAMKSKEKGLGNADHQADRQAAGHVSGRDVREPERSSR